MKSKLMGAVIYREPPLATRGVSSANVASTTDFGGIACFVIPALQFVQLTVSGLLFGSDVCLILALPFIVARHAKWLHKRLIITFICLGLMWLTGQVISDFLNDTPAADYSRGWSKIVLTVTHFVTIALLIRHSRKRFIMYGAGWVLGGVLSFFIAPGTYALDNPWKFGLGWYITTLVCLLAGIVAHKQHMKGVAMMLAIAVINVYAGARSLGTICAVAAIYSHLRMSPVFARKRLGNLQSILVPAALFVGIWGISAVYSYGAATGWLGDQAQEKYAEQSRGEGGFLLGGRSELLASSVAITDAPIFGHGSWAKDPKYAAILRQRRTELGYKNVDEGGNESDLIPSHSHLLGAWVESGFMGAIFWGWVLCLTAHALFYASGREPLLPFFAFIGMTLLWDVLFSPYGAERRFTTTYFIYGMILFGWWSQAKGRPHAYA